MASSWDESDDRLLKVGGLGDVLTGLSRSLQKKGHLVEAILPKYDCMDYSRIKGLKVWFLHKVFQRSLRRQNYLVLLLVLLHSKI